MTFEQIQEVLTNGTTSGPEVCVCNGINALTTATQKTAPTGEAEDLSGLVASVKDASDTTHAVYLTKIDASFLAIVAIAGIMGIQIHDNLKTENPELWEELNSFRQSRYFKTFIGSKDEIASRVIQSIEEVEDGAPAILTSDGKLYISGDMIEQAFSTFKALGFFDSGQTTYTLAELPISDITAEGYHVGTWAEFVEFMNGEWASIKALLNAHQGTPYSQREYWDGREYVNAASNFAEYWATMRTLFADNSTAMEYMNSAENGTNRLYGYIAGIDDQQGNIPNGTLIILNVNRDFYELNQDTNSEVNRIQDRTGRHRFNYYGEAFSLCKVYSYDYYSGYTARAVCNSYIGSADGGYGNLVISKNLDPSVRGRYLYRATSGYFDGYSMGAWFVYTSKSSGGGTPAGITQEDGATIPTNSDVSFTAWVASNLSAVWDNRLISVAPPTFNIALHDQNWYNVMLPYSLGYNTELDGEEEEPSGGAITQQDETTITQQEENETAGVEDTGTNTEDFNAYYESKEGSEKETTGQEDEGEITDEGVEQMAWNSAGMTGIYCPTDAEMTSISNWLWSTDFTDVVTKYLQDPGEALISLQRCWIPFTLSGGQEVVFGRVGSGISVATANKFQSYTVPGSVTVTKFYNNYLDFEGQASIYVPFAGFQALDLRDIMEATLTLKYKWDLASGQGVAELWVARDNMSAPLYQWQINCNEQIPCSSSNQSQFMLGIANTLISTAAGAAAGAAAGPVGAIAGGVTAAASGIAGLHNSQHVSQGGSIGGNAAAVACKTPFITIRYPKNNTPAGYNEFDGVGTDTIGTLGSFSGFVKCQEVHLQAGGGISKAELDAIEAILKEGVLL